MSTTTTNKTYLDSFPFSLPMHYPRDRDEVLLPEWQRGQERRRFKNKEDVKFVELGPKDPTYRQVAGAEGTIEYGWYDEYAKQCYYCLRVHIRQGKEYQIPEYHLAPNPNPKYRKM